MKAQHFEYKSDFEEALTRFEAWWDCAIIDRPLVSISFQKPAGERTEPPGKMHGNIRERWMDTDHVVQCAETRIRNTVFWADSLPIAWPNLGPEIFSAFYGCRMEYGEHTAWSRPILEEMSDDAVNRLKPDRSNFYFRKIIEMTDALIEVGKGRFIVGYTDLHGGADALAAFRDPQNLLIDTIENPAAVKRLCDRITTDFLEVYDFFYERLAAAGMPATTWLPAICKGRFHVPSNDFSCMISGRAFEELFVPGIIRECKHMDRCIYHLDGPQALRHLDCLLDIDGIHAIQWVPGAGRENWRDWIPVYQRIQSKSKALQIELPVEDLDLLFETLRPEGVWISALHGVSNAAQAQAALARISAWTK